MVSYIDYIFEENNADKIDNYGRAVECVECQKKLSRVEQDADRDICFDCYCDKQD